MRLFFAAALVSCLLSSGGTAVTGQCPMGFIKNEAKTDCLPCPVDYKCDGIQEYPERCPYGTSSLGGSFECCPQNATCNAGYAVNPYRKCECTAMECPSEMRKKALRGENVFCVASGGHCGSDCREEGWVQDEKSCICFENKKCGGGQQYWFDGLRLGFLCVKKTIF